MLYKKKAFGYCFSCITSDDWWYIVFNPKLAVMCCKMYSFDKYLVVEDSVMYTLLFIGLLVFNVFSMDELNWVIHPKVTIITSLYNGDIFIEGFLQDIVQQTIFNQCELLIINAHSPGNETPIIEKYCKLYPNIKYIRLSYDPGLYGVWNMGIKLARSSYVTNANVDDRLSYTCYEEHADFLDNSPDIDMVYSDHYISYIANENFYTARALGNVYWIYPEFSKYNNEAYCLGGNHPMWRVSMHDKAGLFDESFASAGDWEMWIRAGRHGSVFKKLNKNLAVFYINTRGLSSQLRHMQEVEHIERMYGIKHQW